MTCWRGAARRVLTTLVVLVAALPSSTAAAAAAATASPPPPTDMGLLVARLGRLEATVREQARETREAWADARALERRVAELEAEMRGEPRDAGEGESQQGSTGEEVRAITEPPDEDLTATRRHLQAASNSTGKVVHIHQATVTIPEGPGWRTSGNYNRGAPADAEGCVWTGHRTSCGGPG
eukprot:SAG25_NODE_135_length_14397_cov_89.177857_6_plen_181_part_00